MATRMAAMLQHSHSCDIFSDHYSSEHSQGQQDSELTIPAPDELGKHSLQISSDNVNGLTKSTTTMAIGPVTGKPSMDSCTDYSEDGFMYSKYNHTKGGKLMQKCKYKN